MKMYISNTFSLRKLANIPATLSVIEVVPRKYEKTTTWVEWMAEYIDYARSYGIDSVESHIWDAKVANILGLPHNPQRMTLGDGRHTRGTPHEQQQQQRALLVPLPGDSSRRQGSQTPQATQATQEVPHEKSRQNDNILLFINNELNKVSKYRGEPLSRRLRIYYVYT